LWATLAEDIAREWWTHKRLEDAKPHRIKAMELVEQIKATGYVERSDYLKASLDRRYDLLGAALQGAVATPAKRWRAISSGNWRT